MRPVACFDVRRTSPIDIAMQRRAGARALLRSSSDAFGKAAGVAFRALLPLGDVIARRRLVREEDPYLHEIRAMAGVIGMPGVWALNLSYEWGCTGAVYASDEGPVLLRALDWPFPSLGEHAVAARLKGKAGELTAVTWPGVAGVFQAVAPGRFACALNQAPMRRGRGGLATDWARERFRVFGGAGLPPSHLLRKTCEEAETYAEAKRMLTETRLALPVIYLLAGQHVGEGCVIERTETDAEVRELGSGRCVVAANHFRSRLNGEGYGWMPRAIDSSGRERSLTAVLEQLGGEPPELSLWFRPPVLNPLSRLVCAADARTGLIRMRGMEGEVQVTEEAMFRFL